MLKEMLNITKLAKNTLYFSYYLAKQKNEMLHGTNFSDAYFNIVKKNFKACALFIFKVYIFYFILWYI